MDFYTSTEAKQYARNRTRIIKEINDIEQTIAEAVDNNQFECDVKNTYMTDTRETVEPSREAKAHCIMQLSKVTVRPREEETKNYFRVGEVLALADEEKASVAYPLEFKVKEVNDNGDIIDLEIVNRGEYDGEIFETADLQYKDMESWLDIDSDFGVNGDLKIDREGNVTVKDNVTTENDDEELITQWYKIGKIWTINDLPDDAFGDLGDAYIVDENRIYFKKELTGNPNWELRNKVYLWDGWKMPIAYGEDGNVRTEVFGKTWIKSSHCGWSVSHHWRQLGEIGDTILHPENYDVYDILEFTRNGTHHLIYKCCNRCFSDVTDVQSWLEKPTNDFGENMDMFIYPTGNYRIKIRGEWMESPTEYRFDQIYLNDDWGDIHDVITYTGDLEPYSTYVKMNNGHWKQVEKVWDLDKYLLGRLPVVADFEWSIKSIVLDEVGDGYIYDTSVIFSDGNATALPIVVNDKITGIKLIYGGDDYTDTIPEINMVMAAPSMGKVYYQVWKTLATNHVLQDEMDQVMSYFNGTRKYTISRVTNEDTGNSFVWHVSWY